MNYGSPEKSVRSISYLEKSVAADPDYALAWGYLAWARTQPIFWQGMSEAASRSVIAAYEKSHELDPEQGEALTAKAWLTALLQWDWQTANKLYLRAMASRENTLAMYAYGSYFLSATDRLPEAIQLVRRVVQRDPLYPGPKNTLAWLLLTAGDGDAAIQTFSEALELNPRHVFALGGLIDAYNSVGNFTAAQAVLQNLPESLSQDPRIRLRAAFCYVEQGELDSAREIYRSLIGDLPSYGIILLPRLALNLGEIDQAIELMERELELHLANSLYIRVAFWRDDRLKDNPRYLALLKRIGLDDESVAKLHRKMSLD